MVLYLALTENNVDVSLGALEGISIADWIDGGATKTKVTGQTVLANKLEEFPDKLQVHLNVSKLLLVLDKAVFVGVDHVVLAKSPGRGDHACVADELAGQFPGSGGGVLLDEDAGVVNVEVAVNQDDTKVLGQVVLEDQWLEDLLNERGSILGLKFLGRVVERLDVLEDIGVVLGGEHRVANHLGFSFAQERRFDVGEKIKNGGKSGGQGGRGW